MGGLKTQLHNHKRHHGAWLGISMPPRIASQGLDEGVAEVVVPHERAEHRVAGHVAALLSPEHLLLHHGRRFSISNNSLNLLNWMRF